MHLVGFDAKVAAAHGFRIVTYPDGSQQSIPANPRDGSKKASSVLRDAGVRPSFAEDTVYGDCGYSYIEADQERPHTIWMRSGFVLKIGSYIEKYYWIVELDDQNGTSYQGSNGGPLHTNAWSHTWDPLTQYGWSTESVVPDNSFVLLTDGSICTAGSPTIKLYVSY